MEKFYKERFRFQERLITKIAPSTELSQIIEAARDELRAVISDAVEVCIFLLDPEAVHYTRPIQCVLHQRPYSCQACKPDRRAVHRAVDRKKAVVITKSDPIFRHGHPQVKVGPEYAVPIMVKEEVFGVVSVVTRPGANYNRADFFFIRDLARLLSGIVLNAKKQWQETLEKIKISKALSHMAPFVPVSIRDIAGRNPEMLNMKKQRKEVTVLFLDIEGYT
ncbi:MAG: GAF domain-containing protein, partial [Desulfobacterales bacterium]|nr:GAF domain-containing protein [Desulfobacterales bacterium]